MVVLRDLKRQRILPRQAPVLFKQDSLAGYQGLVHDTGPVAYWPLDETSGTIVFDRSGHGFHGTYTGATLANTAAPGGGLAPYFDGINDRADMQPNELLAVLSHSEFTMMAWAKVLNAAVWAETAYREVFHLRVNNNNRAYMIKPTTANTFQYIYNGGNSNTRLHQWSISSLAWMHLVLTVSVTGNVMRSYIDTVEFSPPASSITPWVGTPMVGVGCDGSASWWRGWLAHVAIWNRALSADEVAALYEGGR